MNEKRRIRITTTRRRIVRFPSPAVRPSCPVCAHEVEALTTDQAAELLQADDPLLEALIAGGQVHTIQTVSGCCWVCKDSLFTK
jgi:hypothetical protein